MATPCKVARSDQVPEGGCLQADAGGKPVALFREGGALFALDGVCAHRGGPIGQGTLLEGVVTCPWHGWRFEVRTGRCVNMPDRILSCYPVREEGGEIVVEV